MSEAERVGSGCERRSTTVRLSGRAITHTDGGHMAKKKRATKKKKAAKRSTKKRATKKKKVARKKKK
jgi:hypothetical protein